MRKICYPFFLLVGLFSVNSLFAQKSSTSSPYSRFGIGEIRNQHLPQLRALGGIGTGVRFLGSSNIINTMNPASYTGINMTTFDAGLNANVSQLKMAFPMNKAGALSVGIVPFSEVGYNHSVGAKVDSLSVNYHYAGQGGTSKAYLGYGVALSKNFSVGVNVNYVFGTLQNIRSIEYLNQPASLNVRDDNQRYIHGMSYDYGVQYFNVINNKYGLTIGYGGTLSTELRSKSDRLVTRTSSSVKDDTENLPLDTVSRFSGENQRIGMPMKHQIGFSLFNGVKWTVGADAHYTQWSKFSDPSQSTALKDSYGLAAGFQWTPDLTSLKAIKRIDYRLGVNYEKSFIHLNNQDIQQYGVTLGAGIPLPSLFGLTFYKVNVAVELGQMGTTQNELVRSRYANMSLGFTLSDRWFRRYKYD
jgi:hypothetical protein